MLALIVRVEWGGAQHRPITRYYLVSESIEKSMQLAQQIALLHSKYATCYSLARRILG